MSIGLVLVACLMLVALPAASAMASAGVRLVNARGGADPVRLEVTVGGQRTPAGGATAFGKVSDPVDVPAGEAQLSLVGGTDSGVSAELDKTLADGAKYTVVAFPKGAEGFALRILRDGSPSPSQAKLRLVHAAPELGMPDFRIGGRTIAEGLEFPAATKYLTVDPGAHRLEVAKPDGGDVVFERPLPLAAGTATTVVAAGSGGSPQRLIQLSDSSVTPAGAPPTGLGGLAGDGPLAPWLLALLAALGAGTLGGAIQLARSRHFRP